MDEKSALFWTLLEPEHSRAEAFCRRLAGNREDGEDLYQDSLIRALEKFAQLRERESFRPWLYRIVVNSYRNRIRQPWWRMALSQSTGSENGAPPSGNELNAESASGPSPEAAYLAKLEVEFAFTGVTPSEKALITLFEIEGWTVVELAELYRRPSGTIKARLSRARRKMREKLHSGVKKKSAPGIERRMQVIKNQNQKQKVSEVDVCVAGKPIIE